MLHLLLTVTPPQIVMDPSVITAIGQVVTALAVLTTGIAGLVVAIRTNRDVKVTRAEVANVHDLVNSKDTEQLRRIDQLTQSLQYSDMAIPPRLDPRRTALAGRPVGGVDEEAPAGHEAPPAPSTAPAGAKILTGTVEGVVTEAPKP